MLTLTSAATHTCTVTFSLQQLPTPVYCHSNPYECPYPFTLAPTLIYAHPWPYFYPSARQLCAILDSRQSLRKMGVYFVIRELDKSEPDSEISQVRCHRHYGSPREKEPRENLSSPRCPEDKARSFGASILSFSVGCTLFLKQEIDQSKLPGPVHPSFSWLGCLRRGLVGLGFL